MVGGERVRSPAVAGQFYPMDAGALRQELERCFNDTRLGPGRMPRPRATPPERVVGLLAPHAGYRYSGHTAARAFAALADRGTPGALVLLGPNHHGIGPALAVPEATHWATPIGRVAVDMELADALCRRLPSLARSDAAHAQEHSLEVEVPFLQHLYGQSLRLLPVAVATVEVGLAVTLGRALAEVLEGRRAAIVASSDLSHYLPDAEARRRDRMALEAVASLDPRQLALVVEQEGVSMCGLGPAMTMMEACRALGATRVVELGYATSADTSGDTTWVVGYGAMLVE
ncbi:MAG: AmmeMemoRadiSam system protein B [Chloroflexi bacterium]|nr:AmmeMemoRadiSam system protein B [Chloroflexota bacterium]